MKDLIYNGISLNSIGFFIKTKPAFITANRDISFQNVLGHSGDIIVDNQRYNNVEVSYQINSIPHFVSAGSTQKLLQELIDCLVPQDGEYKELRDSWNPGYFREAICTNIEEVVYTLRLGLDTVITFNCKPFWYSDLGQKTIIFENPISSGSSSSNYTIHNPEPYPSDPNIRVYGSGYVQLFINNKYYTINSIDEYIEIDGATGNCYKGSTLCNNNVAFDYLPQFIKGDNSLRIIKAINTSTVDKVEITPNWRRL